MSGIWDFIWQFILPFSLGLGVGLIATILFVLPSVTATLASRIVGDPKGGAELREAEKESLATLVSALTIQGPGGPREDRQYMGQVLESGDVARVIGIGEGLGDAVTDLICAFDSGDAAAYANAAKRCRQLCRYAQAVDGETSNAVAKGVMKIIAPPAQFLESAGRGLRKRARNFIQRWRAPKLPPVRAVKILTPPRPTAPPAQPAAADEQENTMKASTGSSPDRAPPP